MQFYKSYNSGAMSGKSDSLHKDFTKNHYSIYEQTISLHVKSSLLNIPQQKILLLDTHCSICTSPVPKPNPETRCDPHRPLGRRMQNNRHTNHATTASKISRVITRQPVMERRERIILVDSRNELLDRARTPIDISTQRHVA